MGAVNPCPACPAGFVYLTSNGSSTRHAGQVLLRRRLRGGLTASAQYTLAKATDDAAAAFAGQIDGVHGAIALLDDAEDRAAWRDALRRLIDQDGLNGLVAGRATRLLLDEGVIASADATRRMRLVLSPGAEPAVSAAVARGCARCCPPGR